MSLNEYFAEIESFEFGAQFSVFSGFRLVLLDLEENETLRELIRELRSDPEKQIVLAKRIQFLLQNRQDFDQIAFDGTLASYIYSLRESDLEKGFLASKDVLNAPDLWWAAKLALLVRREYLEEWEVAARIPLEIVHEQPEPEQQEGEPAS